MRRIVIALVASAGMLAAVPAVSQASHHPRHHRGHHAARARHRIRHRRFGRAGQTHANSTQGTAGTVTSFTGGVLTIALNDGSTVSGTVTDQTRLNCTATTTSTQGDQGDNDGGDSGSGDNGGSNSGDSGGSNSGDHGGSNSGDGGGASAGQDQGDGDQGQNDQGDDEQMCSTSALVPGTVVNAAELELSSAGAVWQEVDLATS